MGALHSVPQPPDRNRRDIDKTVERRRAAGNKRLTEARGDATATVLALAQNLASVMGLLNHTEQGEALAQVAPPLLTTTSGAYRTALTRKKRGTR
jgi:hypothetical protein